MTTAIATEDAVLSACKALVDEGQTPTLDRVRARIGGGSRSTISRILAKAQAPQDGAKDPEVPDIIASQAKALAASVWKAAQASADARYDDHLRAHADLLLSTRTEFYTTLDQLDAMETANADLAGQNNELSSRLEEACRHRDELANDVAAKGRKIEELEARLADMASFGMDGGEIREMLAALVRAAKSAPAGETEPATSYASD